MKFFKESFLWPIVSFIVILILSQVFELTLNDYIKLTMVMVCVNMILSLSLNLVNGLTGQFSLGHAGFMAVGAYVSAYASTKIHFFGESTYLLNFPIYAIMGGLAAAAAGYVVGLPSLRLKGDYLAIVTLGFGEIIRIFILNTDAVGGARGFTGVPLMGTPGDTQFLIGFAHAASWVVFTTIFIWRLFKTSHGRAFLSVREDEIAAESMGINTTSTKVRAFVISSFFAGVAGSLFAHYQGYLNPSSFSFIKSVDVLIMVVLGGLGSITGSIVAAVFVTVLPEALRPLQELTGVDLRMVIYSLALIILMLTRPEGFLGRKEFYDLFSKKKKEKKHV